MNIAMTYMKATIIGILSALVFAILWVWAEGWLKMYWAMREETGGIGGVSVGFDSAVPAALVGFAAGFYWTVRRARRRRISN